MVLSNVNIVSGLHMLRSFEQFLLGGCSRFHPSGAEMSVLGTGVGFQWNLWTIHQPPQCLSRNRTRHRGPDESWSAEIGSRSCMCKGVPVATTEGSLTCFQIQITWHSANTVMKDVCYRPDKATRSRITIWSLCTIYSRKLIHPNVSNLSLPRAIKSIRIRLNLAMHTWDFF